MAPSLKLAGETASKTVGAFREAIQDLLVMQLRDDRQTKALEGLREELRLRADSIQQNLHLQDDRQLKGLETVREELKLRMEKLSEEMRLRDDKQTRAIQTLLRSSILPLIFASALHRSRLGCPNNSRPGSAKIGM